MWIVLTPNDSTLWHQLIRAQMSNEPPSVLSRTVADVNYMRPSFPSFDFLTATSPHSKRQNSSLQSSPEVIASFGTLGPLLSRLIVNHRLAQPMFVTTLQRDTIDIGGNVGQLSIGELPAGIKTESLTWVPLRTYTPQEGGLAPPSDAPQEVKRVPLINFGRFSYTYTNLGLPDGVGDCCRRCLF